MNSHPQCRNLTAYRLICIAQQKHLRRALEIHADMTHYATDVVVEACRTILKFTENEEHYRAAFDTLLMLGQPAKKP